MQALRRYRRQASWLERVKQGETALLQRFVHAPFRQSQVTAGSGDRFLNTVEIGPRLPDRDTIVLTHGYGSGLGFWARTFDAFSNLDTEKGFNVIAVDWLGMGASSRAPFHTKQTPDNAEAFFIDSLDAWRETMQLEKFHLLGHSLGGFLSGAYAIKYPDHISHLFMVSPVGLQNMEAPEPLADSQAGKALSFQQRLLLACWENNITPQHIVRAMGPWGQALTDRLIGSRFDQLPPEDLRLMSDYMYLIASGTASGEYALNAMLQPVLTGPTRGVYAKHPIGDRLLSCMPIDIPITVLFGDHDWMRKPGLEQLPLFESGRANLFVVDHSGHHVYLDNPDQMISVIRSALRLTAASEP